MAKLSSTSGSRPVGPEIPPRLMMTGSPAHAAARAAMFFQNPIVCDFLIAKFRRFSRKKG